MSPNESAVPRLIDNVCFDSGGSIMQVAAVLAFSGATYLGS